MSGERTAGFELILVRHGQPQWVDDDGINRNDPPLTDRGVAQAAATAATLAPLAGAVDAIWVSPMVRARQTAEPIEAALGLDAIVHPFLREIRNPDEWDGSTYAIDPLFVEARRRPVVEQWNGMPGGETFRDFHDRVGTGLGAALAECGVRSHPDPAPLWEVDGTTRRIVVVAHAGTNSVVLTHLLGIEPVPWEWERFVLHHAAITRLSTLPIGPGHSFALDRLSDTAHFDADLVTR